jgi:hypothetical protein
MVETLFAILAGSAAIGGAVWFIAYVVNDIWGTPICRYPGLNEEDE